MTSNIRLRIKLGAIQLATFPFPSQETPDEETIRQRLFHVQSLEAVRCLEEGVITDPSQCDVGAILGWGFAPWTGGPLSWIDRMGVAACVQRCDELAHRYGSQRLAPPDALRKLALTGAAVYAAQWPPR